MPLWLEEGLAVWLGWEIALAYQETRHFRLYRQQEPVPDEHRIPWSVLFALDRYPEKPVHMAAFYRQTGALMQEITDGIGEERLREFVEGMVRKRRLLRDVLVEDYEWTPEDVDAMKERVERVVKKPAEQAK